MTVCLAVLLSLWTHAEESTQANNENPLEKKAENRWFVFGGGTNYRLPLKDCERDIDILANGALGSLMPGWKKPRTFKDWSDESWTWEGWFGIGRDLGPSWSWFLETGGAYGYIPNSKWYYPGCAPLKVKVNFQLEEEFVETGVDWYPWGKPHFEGSGIGRRLRAARPYVSLGLGHVWVSGYGKAEMALSAQGRPLEIKVERHYNEFYANPRIAVETPLSRRDSASLFAGYSFFEDRQADLNSIVMGASLRHKF